MGSREGVGRIAGRRRGDFFAMPTRAGCVGLSVLGCWLCWWLLLWSTAN